MSFMSLIQVNINVHSNNSTNHSPQGQERPPTDEKGKRSLSADENSKRTSLIDWFCGTLLAYYFDPHMAFIRAWMVDVMIKLGENPGLAPATAVFVSSAVLCAAPALVRWIVRFFYS